MMSEGELLQMEKARNLNMDEDAFITTLSMAKPRRCWHLPVLLAPLLHLPTIMMLSKCVCLEKKQGMAFQIKDDLFDYGNQKIGKPTGNDIKGKKLTLPLIYTLNHVDGSLRRQAYQYCKE